MWLLVPAVRGVEEWGDVIRVATTTAAAGYVGWRVLQGLGGLGGLGSGPGGGAAKPASDDPARDLEGYRTFPLPIHPIHPFRPTHYLPSP